MLFIIVAQGNGTHNSFSMGSGHGSGMPSRNNGATTSSSTGNGRSGASCLASSSFGAPSSIVSAGTGIISSAGSASEPMNDIEKYLNIRKQVEQRRKNLFPVQPKPPQGFKDYLMNRKTYLLQVIRIGGIFAKFMLVKDYICKTCKSFASEICHEVA